MDELWLLLMYSLSYRSWYRPNRSVGLWSVCGLRFKWLYMWLAHCFTTWTKELTVKRCLWDASTFGTATSHSIRTIFQINLHQIHITPPRFLKRYLNHRLSLSQTIQTDWNIFDTQGGMFGILKFQTFLLVVLLFICSCTYLHWYFPGWFDRNKTG